MKRLIALFLLLVFALSGCVSTIVTAPIENISKAEYSKQEKHESEFYSEDPSDESLSESLSESSSEPSSEPSSGVGENNTKFDISTISEFSGEPYCVVNDNIPTFSADELSNESYEYYSPLDSMGRCGVTIASIGRDIMPTEDRGNIGSVKPSGWHTVKYDIVDGKYLYNRCHLIGFQLTGENANTKNLITGTRYLNVDGMLPFENMVADYVKETGNHVAYRVTPIFEGDNLLASGVHMEAYSIEDDGDGICFNVYCYNVHPGIEIDYKTGESRLVKTEESTDTEKNEITYVLNTKTKKFHYPSCDSVDKIKEDNYAESDKSREELIAEGYSPCGNCDP